MRIDLEQVLREHASALGRVAALHTRAGPEREDLLQDMGLALLTALPRFRADSSLKTYVLRIAHNCGARHLARRGPVARELDEETLVSGRGGPERDVSARRDIERLSCALRELPLGSRQVLALALEGLTHAEIGEALDLQENAVSVRLHRARAALRQTLAADAAPASPPAPPDAGARCAPVARATKRHVGDDRDGF